jgi:hypothetical protein
MDDFLWHDFYDCYVNALPYSQDPLGHLRNVGGIAGKYARQRFGPSNFLPSERLPTHMGGEPLGKKLGSLRPDLIHALIAAGNEGLLAAVRTFDPAKGTFSTHAGPWIRKYIGPEAESLASVVYRPRRKTTLFDASFTYTGGKPDDKEVEVRVGPREDYLQRSVSFSDYPWEDQGTYQLNGKPWPPNQRLSLRVSDQPTLPRDRAYIARRLLDRIDSSGEGKLVRIVSCPIYAGASMALERDDWPPSKRANPVIDPYCREEWQPFFPRQTLWDFLELKQWRKPTILETAWYVISNPERTTDGYPQVSDREFENPRAYGGSFEKRRTAKAYD